MIRKRTLTRYLLLLGGLYAAGLGLWHLAESAIFVHEAVVTPAVVTDVRERPFEDYFEALQHGNLPWEGSVAHRPHVHYEVAGRRVVDDSLPDWDNHDYNRGESVEIIIHPQHQENRHLNKFKFIWGKHLAMLGLGALALLLFRITRRRRRAAAAPVRRRRSATAEAVAKDLPAGVPATVAEPVAELVQDIVDPPAPKKRRRSPAKPKDPNAPAKPRRSSKSSAAATKAPAAPKKRRRKTKDSARG